MTFKDFKDLSRYDKIILLIIIVISAFLRLWHLHDIPFMHDEFSALGRTCYDNFHDLIREGVMLNDSHPAGTQVLVYALVQLFGWSEFWLKLPFALMGIASVYLVFVIANQWFNKNVGLVSAAFASVSELFLFYSQLARPYSPGLFFTLLLVYFWNRILFDKRDITIWICIGFAISAFLAAEMHMFSLAQAGLIALTGLFFLRNVDKKRKKAYLWSCVAALALYLPTFPVFYYQLFVYGSIGGWLGKPAPTFLTDFLQYSANYSNLFIFIMLMVILLPLIVGNRVSDTKIAIRICCLLWFVVPLAVAWAYSLLKEPILQFSTLIFSYPFLIILAFSFYDGQVSKRIMTIVLSVVVFLGVTSLIVDRQYFYQMYHQGYDQVAVEMKKAQERYGDNISCVSYSCKNFVAEHYQNKFGVNDVKCFNEDDEISDYQQFIMNCDDDYMAAGFTDHADMSWELSAVAEYPFLEQENAWFTTRYLVLSKNDNGHPLLHLIKENVNVREGEEWASNTKLADVEPCERMGIIADIQALDTIEHIALVAKIIDKNTGQQLCWFGYEDKNHVLMPGERAFLTNGFIIPKDIVEDYEISVFIWNISKKPFIVNKLSYYQIKKNPYFYGLYEPLE